MKTHLILSTATALLLTSIHPLSAKDKSPTAADNPPSASDKTVPDFLKEIVLNAAPPPTKQQLAFTAVYQLNNSMFNIYDNSLAIYQKNIRARVPLIMALFSGKGGRFILYRPGQEPLEAPSVPPIYQAAKSVGHCAMATYACVAPYIADAKADTSWITLMKSYRLEVQMAKEGLVNLDAKPEEQALLRIPWAKF